MQDLSIGDILFFMGNSKSRIDNLIMKRTKSPIVHCAVVISSGLIIQAETGGIRIRKLPNNYYAIGRTYAYGFYLNQLEDLECLAGSQYGFSDVISQLLNLLPGGPTISLDKSYDCSHLVAIWLQSINYQLPFGFELNRATPGSLFNIFNDKGEIELNII